MMLTFLIAVTLVLTLTKQNTSYVEKVVSSFSNLVRRFDDHRFMTLESRGYDRLWKFPEFLILGAGEGVNARWTERTWFLGEIHSTFVGVLFYYGLPGFAAFLTFLYSVWRNLGEAWIRLSLLSPLVYSVAIYNVRNWFFWIGIAVLYVAGTHLRIRRSSSRSPG